MIKMQFWYKVVGLTLLIIGIFAYTWESPDINYNSKLSVSDCIALDEKNLKVGEFTICYSENSSPDCINPYFPSIHINFRKKHNTWLQVVRTNHENYRVFIDSVDKNKYPELYPFYQKIDNPYSEFTSADSDFYDAPLWFYKLWRPEVEWIGHAYPVDVDYQSRVVRFYSGISWGFKFGNYRLRPTMILPTTIGRSEIESDWEILKAALDGYNFIIVE